MLRKIILLAASMLAFVVIMSCNPADTVPGATTTGYTTSAKESALDARTSAWVTREIGAEEWETGITPTVTLSYAADSGDEGTNDGAVKLVYSGESGTKMSLSVFSLMGPKSLSTSGTQTISIKVKPVSGCVCKAVAFVSEETSASSGWHESASPFNLPADTWTTVTATVDASTFTYGVYRVGILFIGDTSGAPFASSGTIYIDEFSALDLRKNEYSSSAQLANTCYNGTDTSAVGTITQSWEASSSSAGDGYIVEDVTFPASVPATGWGAWVGGDFGTYLYGTTRPVDLSSSTLTIRMYVSQAAFDALAVPNTGTWLSIYDSSQTAVQIGYNLLNTISVGWNTITINFADARLHNSAYVSGTTTYDFSSVTGFNIGIGSQNSAMNGKSVQVKLDWLDITQN